jgi:hypothetical protein
MKKCGAKKRNGQPCQKWPIKGRTRCRLHGGKSRLGAAAGRFLHGRYSSCLPTRLAAAYEDATHDPQLLELRHDIALTDARIVDLLHRVDRGESGALWQEAHAAFATFRREQAKNNIPGMQLALTQAEQLITQGTGDYAAWQEVSELIEQRRRVCESEHRRLVQSHQMLNVEQAMTLLAQVVDVIQRHVRDKAVLSAIAQEFQALGNHEGNGSHHLDDAC